MRSKLPFKKLSNEVFKIVPWHCCQVRLVFQGISDISILNNATIAFIEYEDRTNWRD